MPNIGFATREIAQEVLDKIRQRPPFQYRQGPQEVGAGEFLRMAENGYGFRTGTGGIPGASGTTLGSAECTLQYIDENGERADLTIDGDEVTETVYNYSTTAVAAEVPIIAILVSGLPVCIWEDC